MHIPVDRLDEAYEQIKAAALAEHGAETVAIFVAPDVDAVCACKLFLTLLQTDWIPHKVVPVTSYSHLAESASDLLASHAFVRSLIFINCGGITDLAPLLPNLQPHHRVYVLDSRRPLNLDNLFANELVAVLDDGHVDKDLVAEREAYDRVEFAPDESDGEDDDEDEDEEMEDNDEVDVDGDDDEPDADEPDPDPDATNSDKENAPHHHPTTVPNPRKRKRAARDTADTRRRHRRQATRAAQATLVDYYAQGTWYGTSVAMLAFDLVHQVGRATVDAVWCAILGVTYQYEHELIAEPRYLQAVRDLDAHVARLSPTADTDAAAVPGGDLAAAAVRVSREPDVRVPLYRHWTLWDALAHARGISCRLATWTPRGVDRLQFLLTKMGVPMDEYRKPFLHMDKALKDAVWTQLETHAPLVRLDRLTCPTFVRSAPLVTPVSATDAVAALGALAVSPAAAVRAAAASAAGGNAHDDLVGATVAVPSGPAGDAAAAALLTGAPTSSADAEPDPSAVFYALLDALTKPRLLAHGLAAARTLAKAVVTVAGAVVVRRAIKTMKGFRYAMIHDGAAAAASSSTTGVHGTALAHPVALRLLTLQLAGALREINRVELPLVTAVLRGDGVYVVMGHVAAQTPGMVRRNMLGEAFQAAAEATNARHRQDAFDAAVVEVAREDIGEYLEQLQVELARMRTAA
ncbi:hypothetical protein GGF32_007793 [Allomyces javanicus]|nr:hypothetical protein GGF32_007793 [Allomyces javanicus]